MDQEFLALGACQIASGLSQGFAVAGADSRTAVNDDMGGKTQMAGVIAAVTMVAVLFFTELLRYLPVAALGAVLIVAAVGLFDVGALQHMWRVNRAECALSVVTTFGVIWLDLLHGILMAVVAALLLLIKRASRPPDAILGRVPGMKGWHAQAHHEDAVTHPGLLVYRFGSAIVFFNAGYFKNRVMELVGAHPDVRWLIVDGSTINLVDVTGAEMLESLTQELAARSIRFGLANARREVAHHTGAWRRAQAYRTRIHVPDPQQRKRRVPFQNKGMIPLFLRRLAKEKHAAPRPGPHTPLNGSRHPFPC